MRFEKLTSLERELAQHNLLLHQDKYSLRPGTYSENKVALVGGAGHIFIAEGGNNWHSQLGGRINPTYDLVGPWREVFLQRRRRAEHAGVKLINLVVPEKQLALHAYIGHDTMPVTWNNRPIARIMSELEIDLQLIYPLVEMREAQPWSDLYWRGNSHWCASGCVIAAEAVVSRFGLEWDLDRVRFQRSVLQHDLLPHFKIEAPFEEVVMISTPGNIIAEHRPYRTTGSHEGSSYVIRNVSVAASYKLVIFGDSCSFDTGLGYCLSSFFTETHFLWRKDVDWNYIDRNKINYVLCENAERFLLTVPSE